MNARPVCGDPERLRALLDDRLPQAEQDELTAHLEGCATCQRAFEELAAGSRWWSDVRRYAPNGAGSDSPPPTVSASATGTPHATDAETLVNDDAELGFLDAPAEPGDLGRFGPYRVLGVIGRGGMGVVLRAFDPALHRPVAVKVLAPELAASATARRRFLREARAAASVVHDHVVTIHSVDEAKGLPYLVMQLIEGKSLQERLDRSGPLELAEILRIGRQAARGLAAAHEQGLVHRDIKPSNILLENGIERVRLTDFGLARAADDASLTQSGVIAGTPQYMAPEQARGEAVDHRADLFSLGSVLYAMGTGRPPFRAPSALAVLRRVAEDAPRPIREINPDIPDWLAAIVARLHAKDPAERFQSAEEVAELLGRHLADLQGASQTRPHPDLDPVPAAKNPPGARTARRRRLIWAAALLLVVIAGLGFAEASGAVRLSDLLATVLRVPTRDGTLVIHVDDPNVALEIDGETVAIRGAGPQVIRLRPGTHRVRAERDGLPLLDQPIVVRRGDKTIVSAQLEAAGVQGLKPAEAGAAAPQARDETLAEIRQFQAHPSAAKTVAFSPDGRLALSGSGYPNGDRSMRLWDVETGREIRRFHGETGQILSVAFSPDGRLALTGGQDPTVRLWDVSTGNELRQFEGHPAAVNSVAFFSGGRRAVSAGFGDSVIRLWDLTTGKELRQFEGHTAAAYSVAPSPDGTMVLSGGEDRTVRLWDAATGQMIRRLDGPTRFVESVAFSPDGRIALAGGHDAVAWLWDARTGKQLARLEGHEGMIASVAFTSDGAQALTVVGPIRNRPDFPGAVRLWDVNSGRLIARAMPEDGKGLWSVVAAPHDRRALTGGADGRLRLWRLPPLASPARQAPLEYAGAVRIFEGHTDHPEALALTRDGRRALSGGKDRTVRFWDLPTGRELRRLTGHEDEVSGVAVSSDGRLGVSASLDRTVRIWDLETGRERRRLEGHERKVRAVALSPDARLALTGSEESALRLWDVETGGELLRLSGHAMGICCVAFSPDGRRALSGSVDGTARLWDVETGSELRTFVQGTPWVSAVAFVPDGRRALTGRADGSVSLWDADSGAELHRFAGLGTMVRTVASDPKERLVLAAGTGALRVFDTADRCSLYSLRGVGGGIICAALLPDSRHILLACYNHSLQLWRLPDRLAAPDSPAGAN